MSVSNKKQGQTNGSHHGLGFIAGLVLIASGALILADQSLRTGWLFLIILPAIGITFLVGGIRDSKQGYIISGGIISGLGVGCFLFFTKAFTFVWQNRVGLLLLASGLGWILIAVLSYWLFHKSSWWALVAGTVLIATGWTFLSTPFRVTDFILYIGCGLGIALLLWGILDRLLGLIIPGSLLLGLVPGIYAAWGGTNESNTLARTGIMLVGFALGWGLITLFSKMVIHKFLWWPLIPGGILAMVGWGLYIGGNPGNAVSFIGNTGSIGLIIFGIYLMLLKRGIHS